MYRYVAFVWNEQNAQAAACAQRLSRHLVFSGGGWRNCLDAQGLSVFHTDVRPGSSEAYTLQGRSGVVLSRLFSNDLERAHIPEKLTFDADTSAAISSSRGRWLINNKWGRYVAFLKDPLSKSIQVIRDPTGALPCFVTEFEGLSIYFSFTEDVLALVPKRFPINWRYVRVYACYPFTVQTRDTGVEGIFEVQPGECREMRADGSIINSLYWDPVRIAREQRNDDPQQAVSDLRRVTQAVINAWASCYPDVVHTLSGGLDSSLVALCVNAAPVRPNITYLHFFNRLLKLGDERERARRTAALFTNELIEHEHDERQIRLDIVLKMPRSANPWPMQYHAINSHIEHEVARRCCAKVFFSGVGGDQLYYQGLVDDTPGDFIYDQGLIGAMRKGLPHRLLEVARTQGLSIGALSRRALKDGLRPRWNPGAVVPQTSLVRPEVAESARHDPYLIHPWLETRHGLPLGKLRHIHAMGVSHDFYDPLGPADGPERVRPLISQPLTELCLKKPSYVLAAHGRDRWAVRYAFSQDPSRDLPRAIAWQHSKGQVDQFYQEVLRHNASFARELMLDSDFAQEVLTRDSLEEALNGGAAAMGPASAEVVAVLIGLAAWTQCWMQSQDMKTARIALG